MSDQAQGPGWWLASDGKWYPPEQATTPAPTPHHEPISPGSAETPNGEAEPGWPKRAWTKFRSWPLWVQIVCWVLLAAVLFGPFTDAEDPEDAATSEETTATTDSATTTEEPASTTVAPTTTATAPTTAPPPTEPPETVSQQNARQSAANYLELTSFSRSGLIQQLEFEGFSTADASHGVDALNVDWNEQAALKAAEYLDFTSFSRSGLIQQLTFEGFSQAEAEYGVNTTGL